MPTSTERLLLCAAAVDDTDLGELNLDKKKKKKKKPAAVDLVRASLPALRASHALRRHADTSRCPMPH